MEKQQYTIGDRVEKLCLKCREERGHVVVTVTKRGLASSVECPKCGTRSSFKGTNRTNTDRSASQTKASAPYDWTRTYRTGQTMMHPTYGLGEVTAVIEAQKIDVLFQDRLRRLIHARSQA